MIRELGVVNRVPPEKALLKLPFSLIRKLYYLMQQQFPTVSEKLQMPYKALYGHIRSRKVGKVNRPYKGRKGIIRPYMASQYYEHIWHYGSL